MKQLLNQVESKKELVELQQTFFEIITRPLKDRSKMKPDKRASAMIEPSTKLTPHDRLEVYAQQYWWRVLDSFEEDFPGVKLLIGEKRFESLSERYISEFPSTSFTLRNLGRELVGFLKRDKLLPEVMRKQAAAIAAVEWAQIETYDAASLPPLRPEDLQDSGQRLTLAMQPYVQLVRVAFTVDEFLGEFREAMLRSAVTQCYEQCSSA